MSTPVTYVGNQYSIPAYNDTGYAQGAGNLSSYMVALATGSLTLSGGAFPLTADANFGASFGLVSTYFKSRTASIATAGILRLAHADTMGWLNQAGGGNLLLSVNASDQLLFNGAIIAPSGGAASFTNIALTNTTNQILLGTTNTVTISSTAPAASRVYTIPDAGGAAQFILSAGAQTLTGAKTYADQTLLLQEVGGVDVVTINVAALGASRAYTIPDAGAAASFLMTVGAQAITGAKTFANQTLLLQEISSTDVITINVATLAASRAYTMPDAGASADFVMTEGAQTINGAKTLSNLRGTMGANIAAGGFIFTGLGAGAAAGNSVRYEQLKIVQVVTATFTSTFSTTSTSFASSNITASITPTSASNKVLVLVSSCLEVASTTVGASVKWTIDRSSTNIGDATEGFGEMSNVITSVTTNTENPFSLIFPDSPATTSARTYTIQLKVSGAGVTGHLPRLGSASSITLVEVAP